MNFLKEIQSPPKEFGPAAFWFWYGELKPEWLREQINMMVEQGVYQGFMHARAYLKTPYLGDEWWEAVSACIDEGEKTGFHPWLYDEYAWPSGTAGSTFDHGFQEPSRTLAKGECNMARSLVVHHYPCKEIYYAEKENIPENETILNVFCGREGCWRHVEEGADIDEEVLVFCMCVHKTLVDYMNKETIREFMDVTHEEYKARFGEHFGNRIPGLFFDEIYMVFTLPWTVRLNDEFKKRHGYDLLKKLPALVYAGGEEERKIRKDYYQTVGELYKEAFFEQVSEWCDENQLWFTGHIEEWLYKHPSTQGSFFDTMSNLSIPGADCHDYRYRFPRKITYREPKFSVSVARGYGKRRAMSEALGGAGWACSLQEFKRGINTLGAMGISMLILHGFHSQCESQGSQADWPNSFFFQNPYWRYFKNFADYMRRICYMNSLGKQVVDVGLYYPIDEMRMETLADGPTSDGWALDAAFNEALKTLIEHQIDVDMIDEQCLLNAEVNEGLINAGSQKFRVLVCPDVMEPTPALQQKLEQFVEAGGKILYYSCGKSCKKDGVPAENLAQVLRACFQQDVTVLRGDFDNFYVNHRKIEGQEVYFITNSVPKVRSWKLLLRERGTIQKLSPEDGELQTITCMLTDCGTEIEITLQEDEACWLIVSSENIDKPASETIVEELAVAGEWEFLPIHSSITGEKQLSVASTEMSIPLATFASATHPNGRQIRIQNTADEQGYCGRHLSLWEANWITHRPEGADNSCKNSLWFRRNIILEEKPTAAKICIVAINEWTLWINGEHVADCDDAKEPSIVDIVPYLMAGENVFAIEVRNKTPLRGYSLFPVDELPAEALTSLLAQAEIYVGGRKIALCTDREWIVNEEVHEGWEQPSYKPEVHFVQASAGHVWTNEIMEGVWINAWERGCPPLCPWGDLPLFGEFVNYPEHLCYSITLPAGTKRIAYPKITGTDACVTVDGMPVCWKEGYCELRVDGNTHQLQIALTVNGPNEGLHQSIEVEIAPFRTTLSDWRLHGLKWYSGLVRYRNNLRLKKGMGRYVLELGQTAFYAEVWVNGKKVGERVWQPYCLDVTGFLCDGDNDIVVIVANAAAVSRQYMLVDEGMAMGWNRYWNYDGIQREGDKLVSGLLGPIQLNRIMEV